jgi:hypothetical protein
VAVLVGLIGVVVVVVAVVTLPLLIASSDDVDEAALNELMTASDELTAALRDERITASTTLVGQEQLVDLPAADNAEARRATDEAVAAYEAMAAEQDETVRSQLDGAFGALDGRQDLRSEIDSQAAGDASQYAYANDVFDRYGEIIDAVSSAQIDALAALTDDPDARLGLDLMEESRRQLDAIPTVSVAMASNLGGLTTPESIEAVATLQEELLAGRVTVMGLAEGTLYEAPAVQLDAALEAAGLTAVVDDALSTGQADLPRLLEAMPVATDAWLEFQSAVEALTLDRIDD